MAKILIVDDDANFRETVQALLGEEGHESSIAENGAVAIQTFNNVQPDLVILDMLMPKLGGFDCAAALRETPLPIEPEDRGFDESWIDPFLGVRWGIGFGQYNRWLFWIRTDLGGFGISSDLAFNAAANFGFRISRVVSVSLGGRYMYTDYTSGTIDTDDDFAYQGDESGLLLGLGFRF